MSAPPIVSASVLREGSWYALEQAGRLLHVAVGIYDGGDPATALSLAMFGREEVGRWRILQSMADEVEGGKRLSVADVNGRLHHIPKQEASAISTTLRLKPGDKLADAVRTKMTSAPLSPEWKEASVAIDLASDEKRASDPQRRHKKRIEALYVDLRPDGSWSRPCETEGEVAREEIEDARNEYSLQRLKAMKAMAGGRFGTKALPPLLEPPVMKPFG